MELGAYAAMRAATQDASVQVLVLDSVPHSSDELVNAAVLTNVGVNTGTLPTKGLTLPFISYGGNSLIVCCALLGLVLRVQLERGRTR